MKMVHTRHGAVSHLWLRLELDSVDLSDLER